VIRGFRTAGRRHACFPGRRLRSADEERVRGLVSEVEQRLRGDPQPQHDCRPDRDRQAGVQAGRVVAGASEGGSRKYICTITRT
jgi:hypothetical protein